MDRRSSSYTWSDDLTTSPVFRERFLSQIAHHLRGLIQNGDKFSVVILPQSDPVSGHLVMSEVRVDFTFPGLINVEGSATTAFQERIDLDKTFDMVCNDTDDAHYLRDWEDFFIKLAAKLGEAARRKSV